MTYKCTIELEILTGGKAHEFHRTFQLPFAPHREDCLEMENGSEKLRLYLRHVKYDIEGDFFSVFCVKDLDGDMEEGEIPNEWDSTYHDEIIESYVARGWEHINSELSEPEHISLAEMEAEEREELFQETCEALDEILPEDTTFIVTLFVGEEYQTTMSNNNLADSVEMLREAANRLEQHFLESN